jgi:zinc/manganese transport system substrate-binding protein
MYDSRSVEVTVKSRNVAWVRKSRMVALVVGATAVLMAGCSSDSSSENVVSTDEAPAVRIVVTNSILGSIVGELVGGENVKVIVPNGKDPHDYEPSAKDVSEIMNADLVVETGLSYDEGLDKSIESARSKGVAVFTASDHVTLREDDHDHDKDKDKDDHDHDEDDHDHDKDKDDHDHDHDGDDPHFLSDPLTMKQMVPELVKALEAATSADLSQASEALLALLDQTHEDVESAMATLGDTPCVLVTGHESLNYFAARYNCEIVGTIIPSLSSTAEATAGNLARLRQDAQAAGVNAVFVDEATPTNVANQIASEIGVGVYQLPSHTVPQDGEYRSYVIAIANVIVEGLLSK